eukprot:7050579-Lingulodinium_polyedra.AAC.1
MCRIAPPPLVARREVTRLRLGGGASRQPSQSVPPGPPRPLWSASWTPTLGWAPSSPPPSGRIMPRSKPRL